MTWSSGPRPWRGSRTPWTTSTSCRPHPPSDADPGSSPLSRARAAPRRAGGGARDAGRGAGIAKTGGTGRRPPHLVGAGQLEMLGWQLRLELLALGDRDRKGWIRTRESFGRPAVVANLPPGIAGARHFVSFGRFGD